MKPEQIHMISVQAPQTSLNGTEHVLAMVAAKVGIVRAFTQGVFCGNYKTVPIGGDEFSNKFLACAISIVVGCVNIIATCFYESIEDLFTLSFWCAPAPAITKRHRAKRELGDT